MILNLIEWRLRLKNTIWLLSIVHLLHAAVCRWCGNHPHQHTVHLPYGLPFRYYSDICETYWCSWSEDSKVYKVILLSWQFLLEHLYICEQSRLFLLTHTYTLHSQSVSKCGSLRLIDAFHLKVKWLEKRFIQWHRIKYMERDLPRFLYKMFECGAEFSRPFIYWTEYRSVGEVI